MKVAITGGSNPYALNLARLLLQQGHEVIGIGRSSLKSEAFTLGAVKMGYQYHVYSIGPDTEFVMDLLKAEKPEVIVNYAAQGEGQASFDKRNVKYFYQTNTSHLIEFAEALQDIGYDWLRLFLQVSSSEVYGSVSHAVDENYPTNPSSKYANSKLAFDNHLKVMARHDDFPAIIVRPSNCYCEGQQLHRVIPKAFICALTGKRLELHGGGKARKSYLHADDLSRAIVVLESRGEVGEVYNVGPENPISIRRLLEYCALTAQMGFDELVKEAPEREGQDACYWLDSRKIRDLGWVDSIPIGLGLRMVYDWVEQYRHELLELPTDYRLRA